jgi:hypothetical protein
MPLTTRPPANSNVPMQNGHTGPRRSVASPPTAVPTRLASMKALNTQPYHAIPPRSALVSGRMVATARASKAVATTVSASPKVSRPSGGFQRLPRSTGPW